MTIKPLGPGLRLSSVSATLLVFAWITVILRVIVRAMMLKSFGRDDALMCAGLIFFTLACVSTITGAFNGIGAHQYRLNEHYEEQGRMYFMFFQLSYIISTTAIKASICVALLRITNRKVFRYPLYAIITLAICSAIICDVTVLAQCRPVSATWNKRVGHCAPPSVITGVSYLVSATSVLTDWTTAVLPVFILWSVQLPGRVKLPLGIVLALGVVASTATLIRLKVLQNYANPDDYLYNIADVATWSMIEAGTGTIAGSLATLRPLLKLLPFFSDARPNPRDTKRLTKRAQRRPLKLPRWQGPQVETKCQATKKSWGELSSSASQDIWKRSEIKVEHNAKVSPEGHDKEVTEDAIGMHSA